MFQKTIFHTDEVLLDVPFAPLVKTEFNGCVIKPMNDPLSIRQNESAYETDSVSVLEASKEVTRRDNWITVLFDRKTNLAVS